MNKQKIAGFDGIRAVAVLMVFLGHRVIGADALFLGGFGLRIFFVLSGFLIVGLLHRERLAIEQGERSISQAWKTFTFRRAARIFPLYYALLIALLIASLCVALPQLSGLRILVFGLFLTNIYVEHIGQWLEPVTHIWSLAVEEQFYALSAPLILCLPSRWTRQICMGIAAAAFIWTLWLSVTGDVITGYVSSWANFGLIAIGGAAALRPATSSYVLSARVQPLLLAGLILLPLVGHAIVVNPVTRQLAYPLVAAALLAEIRDHQGTLVVKLLELPTLSAIGTVSYGFYLLHPLISPELIRFLSCGTIDTFTLSNGEATIILFAISLLAASASWIFLEKPILLRARKKRSAVSTDISGRLSYAP